MSSTSLTERVPLRRRNTSLPAGRPCRTAPSRSFGGCLPSGTSSSIAAAAVIVGFWGSGAGAALLLVLFAPIWIVTAKLAGLYDRDHRTLRHLTVDELPWLVVWTLSSTAAADPAARAVPGARPDRRRPAARLGNRARSRVHLPRRHAGTLAARHVTTARAHRRRWARSHTRSSASSSSFPDIHAEIAGRIESCSALNERLDEAGDNVDRIVIACSELSEDAAREALAVLPLRAG